MRALRNFLVRLFLLITVIGILFGLWANAYGKCRYAAGGMCG